MNTKMKRTGAGIALAFAVAAGGVGLLQLDDEPAADAATTEPPIRPAAAQPDAEPGLQIDVEAAPSGSHHVLVGYRVHGLADAWHVTDPDEFLDISGPAWTEVEIDGRPVGGSDGGEMECVDGAPRLAYDETWDGDHGDGVRWPVSGAGRHTITVRAPYCLDGTVVPNDETVTVTVPAA